VSRNGGPQAIATTNVTVTGPAASADLSVHLTGPSRATHGSTFTETLTVVNHGPGPAANLFSGIVIPAGLGLADPAQAGRWGQLVFWTDRSLGADATVSYSVTLQVAVHQHGPALLFGGSVSTTPDPNPFNNFAFGVIRTLG
jgi:hypothetical protein